MDMNIRLAHLSDIALIANVAAAHGLTDFARDLLLAERIRAEQREAHDRALEDQAMRNANYPY